MIYSAPVSASLIITIRRCGRLLLPLSFCVALFGCDNPDASTPTINDEVLSQPAPSDTPKKLDTTAPVSQAEDPDELIKTEKVAADADTYEDEDEGQSLMAAAKFDDSTTSRRAPMISEQHPNTLQATLIGDYVGMLPCASCDSIAVTLNLFSDGSVLKTSIYDNPEMPPVPIAESGIYRQDNDTITIVYEKDHIEIYRILDNHLVMLDSNKEPDADYTLSRK